MNSRFSVVLVLLQLHVADACIKWAGRTDTQVWDGRDRGEIRNVY